MIDKYPIKALWDEYTFFPKSEWEDCPIDSIIVHVLIRFPVPPEYSLKSMQHSNNILQMLKNDEKHRNFIFSPEIEGFNPIYYEITIYRDCHTGKYVARIDYNRQKYTENAKFPIDLDAIQKKYKEYEAYEYRPLFKMSD